MDRSTYTIGFDNSQQLDQGLLWQDYWLRRNICYSGLRRSGRWRHCNLAVLGVTRLSIQHIRKARTGNRLNIQKYPQRPYMVSNDPRN